MAGSSASAGSHDPWEPALRRPLLIVALVAALCGGLLVTRAPETGSATPTITELRNEVARIQAEVASIDQQVGLAAEAYNGAVYHLSEVNRRIEENRRALVRANRRLVQAQGLLGRRLRAAYMQPPPTRIQLLLSSRSASDLLSGTEAMRRAAEVDTQVVTAVRSLRAQRIRTRTQLRRDREEARTQVAARAEQQRIVTDLLARRQAVLAGAKGRLAQELAAEARREAARRAAADRRARQMVARQAAERRANARNAQERSAPSSGNGGDARTERPSSGASPSAAPAADPAPAPAPAPSGNAGRNARAAQVAMQYLGVPYRWGGASPSGGFDCSGLAMYAYGQVGVSMAHYTGAIWSAYPRVTGDLQPGDLVFFSGLGHMGIYIGGGQMVHAPHTGDVVRVASINRSGYMGAVRP